jgi:mono/diheme cytochrome c family protein
LIRSSSGGNRGTSRAAWAAAPAALVLAAALPAAADAPVAGDAVFAGRCAVCHGPDAAGIPGSFPSLHEQIVAFAKTPPGRDYLVMVVTTGLMGELKVGGITYRGVMPAQSGLSEADIAAVITFLGSDRGKNASAPVLTAAEVAEIHARHPDRTPQGTRALRPILPEP